MGAECKNHAFHSLRGFGQIPLRVVHGQSFCHMVVVPLVVVVSHYGLQIRIRAPFEAQSTSGKTGQPNHKWARPLQYQVSWRLILDNSALTPPLTPPAPLSPGARAERQLSSSRPLVPHATWKPLAQCEAPHMLLSMNSLSLILSMPFCVGSRLRNPIVAFSCSDL